MSASPRARVSHVLVFATSLVACGTDRPVAPAPVIAVQLQLSGPGSLMVGASSLITVIARGANLKEVAPPALAWSSSNPAVATIAPNGLSTALVSAVGAGNVTITARAESLSAALTIVVTVPPPPPPPLVLVITPSSEFGDTIQLSPGDPFQLRSYEYDGSPPNIVRHPAEPTLWTSDRVDVVTVNDSGRVTAIAPGNATITASIGQLSATRPIKVASTPGTASARFVNVAGEMGSLTLRPNTAAPMVVAAGEAVEATVPAGTLQVLVDNYPPVAGIEYSADAINLQQFVGFLPAKTHMTLVAVAYGPIALAPLWDWTDPVAPDSAMVRAFLAVGFGVAGGYNVYFVRVGGGMGVSYLRGCYLDWPYGATDYASRPSGSFDIVLQGGKGLNGPVSARFTVTPAPGRATTYIIVGGDGVTPHVLSIVDR